MKALKLSIILLFTGLILITGCKRGGSGDSDYFSYSEGSSSNFTPRGFAAIQGAPLYIFPGGKAEWIGALDFGEELELNPNEIGGTLTPGKNVNYRPSARTIDDEQVFLLPVLWKDAPGWINARHYAPEDSQAGAVIEAFRVTTHQEDRLFNKGDLAFFEVKDSSSFYMMLAPVSPEPGNLSANAIIPDNISFDPNDIEAAKLITKARASRNEERTDTLLKEAAEKYPESVLVSVIQEMLNPAQQEAGPATETLVALFSTASERTAVYAAPNFNSPVNTRLELYTDVRTLERTTRIVPTTEGNGRWYHISTPVEGWIFGLDLEGTDEDVRYEK